jgi:hypothetical protein
MLSMTFGFIKQIFIYKIKYLRTGSDRDAFLPVRQVTKF